MMSEDAYRKIVSNRQWFINHFKQIYYHKNKFAFGTPNALLVIDCFTIFSTGGYAGYRSVKRIHIGMLIKLWDMGFKYHGFPVVEYIKHNNNRQIHYIYQNQLLTKCFKYDESPSFSDVLNYVLRSLRDCDVSKGNYKGMDDLREML